MILTVEEARRLKCPVSRKGCMVDACVKWVVVSGKVKVFPCGCSVNLGYCGIGRKPFR